MKQRLSISNEEIYRLREQGLTYKAIAEHFNNQGIEVSHITIDRRCKEIYAAKGQKEPKLKRGRKTPLIPDEEIYTLREQGLSYRQIAAHFAKQGINISYQAVKNRYDAMCETKGQEETEESLAELDLNLTNSIERKAKSQDLLREYENLEEQRVKVGDER